MTVVQNGFYKVDFHAALPGIGGVVVIENDIIRGGDNQYLYSGTISGSAHALVGEISVAAYVPGAQSVFATSGGKFVLNLSGTQSGNMFTVTAPSPFPGKANISITGTKVADLSL